METKKTVVNRTFFFCFFSDHPSRIQLQLCLEISRDYSVSKKKTIRAYLIRSFSRRHVPAVKSLISALSAPSLFLPLSPHLHLSSFLPYFPFPFPFLSFICSFYILLFFLHLFFFLLLLLPLSTLIFSFVCFAHQHTSEKTSLLLSPSVMPTT